MISQVTSQNNTLLSFSAPEHTHTHTNSVTAGDQLDCRAALEALPLLARFSGEASGARWPEGQQITLPADVMEII